MPDNAKNYFVTHDLMKTKKKVILEATISYIKIL